LRQELENFIPTLKGLETKTIELGVKIREVSICAVFYILSFEIWSTVVVAEH
jgi:hypothetical protein